MKTLLAPLDGAQSNQTVLEFALTVARRFDAHIEAFHVRPVSRDAVPFTRNLGLPPKVSQRVSEMLLKEVEAEAGERAAEVRRRFEGFCAKHGVAQASSPPAEGVTAAWRETESIAVAARLVERARVFDATLVARSDPRRTAERQSPAGAQLEAILLESGRPLILVPPAPPSSFAAHIAIGWNESAEAARATAAAGACLKAASRITVLASERRRASAEALAGNLAWHGIDATVRAFTSGSRAVGETLLADAATAGADLLLIGGYSRARARQLLFGGVTRHLLASAELPVMMAH